MAYQPDLAIVYCGQNEYFRSSLLNELEFPRLIAARNFLERNCRLYQALIRVGPFLAGIPLFGIQSHPEIVERLGGLLEAGPQEQKPISPRVRKLRQDLFRLHLEQMAAAARSARAEVILCTLVVNLRDWPPEPLPYPPELSSDQVKTLAARLASAQGRLAAADAPAAEQDLRQALALAPHYAMTDMLLGRALELEGRREPAREYYLRARQEDATPHRAPAEINTIIREAAQTQGAALLDAEQRFAQASSYPAPGFDLVADHVHPNLAGQALLAAALLQAIQQLPAFVSPAWKPVPPLTEADLIREFQLDPDYLADVYLRLGLYYGIQKNLLEQNAWTLRTFDRVLALRPADPLPRLCKSLIFFSQADDQSALAELNSLRQENPVAMGQALSRYLSRSASLRQNALLLNLPADPLRPPLRGLLRVAPEAKQPPAEAWPPLEKFNRFFAWRPTQQQFIEITSVVAAALKSRREKLAGRSQPLPALYLLALHRPNFLSPGPGLSGGSGDAEKKYWLEGPQAQLLASSLSLTAELVQSLTLEYRLDLDRPLQPALASLYWATAAAPEFSEDRKLEFEVIADGRFHRLTLPLGQLPTWLVSGTVTRLRLDPAPATGQLLLRELSFQPVRE